MKIRRYIAILLMSLANMFILVHAFVPHYHHEGVVTLDASKVASCTLCEIPCNADGCEHDGDNVVHHGLVESCDFGQIIGRDGNPIDDAMIVAPTIAEFLICFCAVACPNLLVPAAIELERNEAYSPYINTYNSPYVGSSFGLRAPPVSTIS